MKVRKPPPDLQHACRWWMTAVYLEGAAIALLVVLTASHVVFYGSTGGGASANAVILELVALVAVVLLITRMRAGQEWAHTVLGAAALPLLAYLVLNGIEPWATGISLVNLVRIGVSISRFLAAAAIVAGVVLMFKPASRAYFAGGRERH